MLRKKPRALQLDRHRWAWGGIGLGVRASRNGTDIDQAAGSIRSRLNSYQTIFLKQVDINHFKPLYSM